MVYNKGMTASVQIPTEELPLWMRQARHGVDWGIVIVFAFSLLAALPFIVQSGLPRTNASENYVFMTHDNAVAMREGRLYPRWSAHVLQGYGAPIPNFYPPGAPYSAALLEILFTNNSITAVRLTYIISIILAGVMTYAFVLRITGASAGILAGVLYLYSPYLGQVAPYVLGDLTNVLALGLLPAFLWSVHRLLSLNVRFDFALVTLISAALVLTEPRMALIAALLAVLTSASFGWRYKHRIGWMLLAIGVGVCLAAFFWLPALAEQHDVQWQASSVIPQIPSLNFNQMFALMNRVDLSELVTTPQFTIGLSLLIFTLLSLSAMLLNRRLAGIRMLFLMSGYALIGVGVFIFPHETWLMGPLSFCLAVGGSAVLDLRQRASSSQRLYLPTLLIFALYTALPVWLAPRWQDDFGSLAPETQIAYEQNGFGVAVLPPGVDIPTTLLPTLEPSRALIGSYQLGPINRLLPDQSQFGRRTSIIKSSSHSDIFEIRVIESTIIDIARAHFDGWQARYGNQTLSVRRNEQTGLTQLLMPARSNGEVRVFFGTTPLRQAAWIISSLTLALLSLSTLRKMSVFQANYYEDLKLLTIEEARLVMLVTGAFTVILILFGLPFSPYTLHARLGHALDNTYAVQSRTETGLELLSYQISTTSLQRGDTLDLILAWRTARPLRANYQVQIQVRDVEEGARWLETDLAHPGGYPTRRWLSNRFVRDYHSLYLPNVVPGNYQIAVEVYSCEQTCAPEDRLTFFDESGQTIGQTLLLPAVLQVSD